MGPGIEPFWPASRELWEGAQAAANRARCGKAGVGTCARAPEAGVCGLRPKAEVEKAFRKLRVDHLQGGRRQAPGQGAQSGPIAHP